MKCTAGIICIIASLLLISCSEDDEKRAECYTGTFLEMESYGIVVPEDVFSDIILPNVEFDKEEIGKGEPVAIESYTVQTEKTYKLTLRETDADFYIETKKETDRMYKQTCVYEYVFKPGTYGMIEISESEIAVNGYPYCGLTDFAMTRIEPVGEKYSQQDTEVENYNGSFSCNDNGKNITLSNNDYVFEILFDGDKCHLTEVSPNSKNIGILERQ